MKAGTVYVIAWIAWIALFMLIEFSALWTGHSRFSLSELVWKLERINRAWTFLRYFVAAFCVWLFGHMVFQWWR